MVNLILHDGKIDSFNQSTQKWIFLLDSNDDDDLYLMAYDALCEYFNKESSTFCIRQQRQRNGEKSICIKDV